MSDKIEAPQEVGLSPGERITRVADAIHTYTLKYNAAHDPRAVFAFVYYSITRDFATILQGADTTFYRRTG